MATTSSKLLCLLAAIAMPVCSAAQDDGGNKINVSGSIQSDIIIPEEDKTINAKGYNEWGLTNTYADVNVTSEHIDAGARFEFVKHPLPTFYDEKGFKGWGVPYVYDKLIKNYGFHQNSKLLHFTSKNIKFIKRSI